MEKIKYSELSEKSKEGSVVVIFSTEWCGECKMTKILIEKIKGNFPNIKFFEIDVDDEKLWENEELDIKQVPTFHFMKDGAIVERQANYIFEANLVSILQKI